MVADWSADSGGGSGLPCAALRSPSINAKCVSTALLASPRLAESSVTVVFGRLRQSLTVARRRAETLFKRPALPLLSLLSFFFLSLSLIFRPAAHTLCVS